MRIGVFEIDLIFRENISIAEVIGGQAPLLRSIHVRNVRGRETDWLKIYAVIGGFKTNRKSVRDLPVHDEGAAIRRERELCAGHFLPACLPPGRHSGELRIASDSGEQCVAFSLNVLSATWIPTDFAHAPLLSAWIASPENDDLRAFATSAMGDSGPENPFTCAKKLFYSLRKRNLLYQPVATTIYPDFQDISDPSYVLRSGGSCADLSLLFAALLWCRGHAPALLVYENHMTVGCFSSDCTLNQGTLDNPETVLRLIGEGYLLLFEVTDLCAGSEVSFEASRNRALSDLQGCISGCCFIHPRLLLRNGTVHVLPSGLSEQQLVCPHCGYDGIRNLEGTAEITCPACGNGFSAKKPVPASVTPVPETISYDPASLRYGPTSHGMGVLRLMEQETTVLSVLPRWQNRAVTSICAHAFENSSISSVSLPDEILAIEDRAFRGCEALKTLRLPEDLSFLGSGAFSGSGLSSIQIPGSLSRIPTLAFANCTDLATVTLGEGILFIDTFAFQHCPRLQRVFIPASVQFVSRSAFDLDCQLIFASDSTRWG